MFKDKKTVATLKEEMAKVEQEYTQLVETRKKILEQGQKLQNDLNQINNRLVELKGSYTTLAKLAGVKPKPVQQEPKKEEKKDGKSK